MNKTLNLTVLLVCIVLLGCNENTKDMNTQDSVEKAFNLEDMDLTVSPGDDFNLYANGGWIKKNPVPADKSNYGTFLQLADLGEKQVRELIEDLAAKENEEGSIACKIGDFYSVGMDSAKVESDGISPLSGSFENIDKLETIDDIQGHIAYMHIHFVSPLFSLRADADSKNSEMVIAQLSQGGLSLPDRDYYLNDDERSKQVREEYKKHISKMFELAGLDAPEPSLCAEIVLKIETRLAKASMTRMERRDPHKTYNKMSIAQLGEIAPAINWEKYFESIGLADPGDVNVRQPEFYKEISAMMEEVPVDDWKVYLRWNLLRSAAPYLSSGFVNENFNFFGRTLTGSEELQPRWKRVVNATNFALSEAVGQMYVKKYFPPEAKERMLTLVANLKAAYADRIRIVKWMSDETKQKALAKLEKINVKIGYPDKWRDYTGLEVKKDAYVLNILRGQKFAFDYMKNKINKPVDKDEWYMPPQMVNAYYEPALNEIAFPAAILQPPFFYLEADDAVNYGAIGVVIGHEMTHGFDDQGRKYDLEGNLNDWWTAEDTEKFKKRTDVLVEQFGNYIVLDTMHANGELTLGENIADLGGLNIAYTALQKVLKDQETEKISGFTPEQRFFLSYAHIWAQNIRDEEIIRRTKTDPHSLGRLRVIGPLRNLPEFYLAFNIKEGDYMYLPEQERAVIW